MKTMSRWMLIILSSFGFLALLSFLENGYEEELLSAEVLQETITYAKAEDALAKRELRLISAEAKSLINSTDQ